MSRKRTRPRFQPDLLAGRPRDAVIRAFREEARAQRLAYACRDCAYAAPDLRCSVGWPNSHLTVPLDAFEVVDEAGVAMFCKAFEPIDS